jgi:hypothetical protein
MTYYESIKTLINAIRYLELEEYHNEIKNLKKLKLLYIWPVQALMEGNARSINKMMEKKKKSKRKSIRDSIMVRERLLRIVLKQEKISVVTKKKVTMLVNAKIFIRYKLQKKSFIFSIYFSSIFMVDFYSLCDCRLRSTKPCSQGS